MSKSVNILFIEIHLVASKNQNVSFNSSHNDDEDNFLEEVLDSKYFLIPLLSRLQSNIHLRLSTMGAMIPTQ